jgi:hypothetical protein
MSIYTIKKKKNNTFSFATRLGWLDAFTVESGSRFHCTTVLGKNEYLK